MVKQSAGLLVYRCNGSEPEVLLVHPGGPFFKNKDAGVWSIPKGEYEPDEEPLSVAIRELEEETGNVIVATDFTPLQPVTIKSGKRINAWAVEGDFEKCFIRSNDFEMEWPPRSGKMQRFPEVDRAEWFTIKKAKEKVYDSQVPLLEQLEALLKS